MNVFLFSVSSTSQSDGTDFPCRCEEQNSDDSPLAPPVGRHKASANRHSRRPPSAFVCLKTRLYRAPALRQRAIFMCSPSAQWWLMTTVFSDAQCPKPTCSPTHEAKV
ncbi:hypothetical protein EVAR_64930_1 [Eumeta japonica]|uniref:Uncharacterized protein n=1 Tax=Eumeta variegata TaxID=151549 RepID=A0A4C1ZD12_EUMVA|nr:hypothetical protein EVAR_64930_1 [Eumeta japonica]